MALEAVVFQQNPLTSGCKDIYTSSSIPRSFCSGFDDDGNISDYCVFNGNNWDAPSTSSNISIQEIQLKVEEPPPILRREKRSRARRIKNKEDVENQRMTHIVVERNRRKQMNDYLSILRSIMPSSYAQRGDQASIVGGAINYVKELEQLLQTLEAQKRIKQRQQLGSEATDVQVTMAEKHATIKLVSKKQQKQLVNIVTGLQSLALTILHLNVTTVENSVIYCFSVKVEDHCKLTSVNEIAAAVYEMIGGVIGEEKAELS